MKQESKNSILALGLLLAAASIPCTWLSFSGVPIESGFSGGMTFTGDLSALDGAKILGIPVWAMAVCAAFACIAQLMAASKFFFIPTVVNWILAVISSIAMTLAILYPMFVDGVTPGVGAFVGLLSAAIPLVMLVCPCTPK